MTEGIRSRSNNVFHYNSYWGNWSRILFHNAGGPAAYELEKVQVSLQMPLHHHTVELDLTAINPLHVNNWDEKVQHANIRSHCTASRHGDLFVGTLPAKVVQQMQEWLSPECIDILLHADLLPYIDFAKGRAANNGGFKFADAQRDYISPDDYLAAMMRDGGPGIMMHDVQESYDALKADWDKKIKSLTIVNGLRLENVL